ncbi:MAG: PilZ domain-containing protein [Candidatus Omnitrophota bacterium]
MVIEKRKFPRADISCKIATVYGERLLVLEAHTENVGEGGIRVILGQRLNVPTTVDLDLFVSGVETPIRCKGEVVWANEVKPQGVNPRLYDTGIKFTEIVEQNKNSIRQLVRSLVDEGKKEK